MNDEMKSAGLDRRQVLKGAAYHRTVLLLLSSPRAAPSFRFMVPTREETGHVKGRTGHGVVLHLALEHLQPLVSCACARSFSFTVIAPICSVAATSAFDRHIAVVAGASGPGGNVIRSAERSGIAKVSRLAIGPRSGRSTGGARREAPVDAVAVRINSDHEGPCLGTGEHGGDEGRRTQRKGQNPPHVTALLCSTASACIASKTPDRIPSIYCFGLVADNQST